VWTDKLLATAILVITVGQNEWLNVTIGLFWDASGFVHLRCSEQTLMEVILTNTKLIPDTLAHQHQLFVCHSGKTSESCHCGSCLFACICHRRWAALSFLCLIWTWRLLYRRTEPSVKESLLWHAAAYEWLPHLSFLACLDKVLVGTYRCIASRNLFQVVLLLLACDITVRWRPSDYK